jgi:deoxycytidylate deaminase
MNNGWDWSELAFASKKPLNALKAMLIAAPRELSARRFTELVRTYLPQGNIMLGLAKESFVAGFEGQPQFRTLQVHTVQTIIDKVNKASTKHRIYTLSYFQREFPYILQKLKFQRIMLVNGSWQQTFHTTPAYYMLASKHLDYQMISPFVDEAEAQAYETKTMKEVVATHPFRPGNYTEAQMAALAKEAARYSFDYSFQTGVALGKRTGKTYDLLAWAYNKVVPYQTFAMHHGASRETNFSPPHDLNHYDTVHAEVELLIKAQKEHIDLKNTTLFINLLPCPACARMFTETDIGEFVYAEDHSSGYAINMLELAGKKVRRLL